MPSPLAHAGAAFALRLALGTLRPLEPTAPAGVPFARLFDRVTAVAAFASIAPDLDLVGGIAWHRGPTHSLVGAAAIGVACALLGRLRGADALAVVAAAVLHVPMDWSTGDPGAPSHYGVPWAWPFSAERAIAAHPWFGAYHIDAPGFLAQMLVPAAVPVYGKELATAAACVATAAVVRAVRARALPRTRDRAP